MEKDETVVRARYAESAEERYQEGGLAARLHAKSEVLDEIFWVGLKDAHKLWGKSVGIRKGWKVVSFKDNDDDADPFSSLIAAIAAGRGMHH
jgi:hypothetical protein